MKYKAYEDRLAGVGGRGQFPGKTVSWGVGVTKHSITLKKHHIAAHHIALHVCMDLTAPWGTVLPRNCFLPFVLADYHHRDLSLSLYAIPTV